MNIKTLFATLVSLLGAFSFAAADEAPAITFHTNLYELSGATNSFTFGIGSTKPTTIEVDCGQGRVKYSVAVMQVADGQFKSPLIPCTVGATGTVKIYANPEEIDFFDGEGAYISDIDFGSCSNLEIVNLAHNQLTRLDLSPYKKLTYLRLSDNPFTEATPLILGPNHPELAILEIAMTDYLEPDFNIGNYPALQSFVAYSCKGLRQIDATKCPRLLQLSIDSTPVQHLDVTNNPNLLILNISETLITDIDLTKCPLLTEFYATRTVTNDAKLSTIDLSHNPELQRLQINSNLLRTLDVSHNPKLIYLSARHNYLTTIDVSNLTELSELNIDGNLMSFATLPMPAYNVYDYDQRNLPTDRSYPIGATLDYSDKVLRDGTVTTARMFAFSEKSNTSRELDASFYTYADGKVTLKRAFAADSLFVQFDNDVFADWPMHTAKFKVKSSANYGKPTAMATFDTDIDVNRQFSLGVSMAGASEATPKTFYLDCGGVATEYTTTTADVPQLVTYTKTSQGRISILVPEGETLTGLWLEGFNLTSLDVTNAPQLRVLTASGTGLYEIDLSMNRSLRSLNLSGNNLKTITLAGANGAYSKTGLTDVNLSHNQLTEVTIPDVRPLRNLDMSFNQLTKFEFKDFDFVSKVNVSDNLLTAANLSYMTAATDVNLSGNYLTELILPETNVFQTLDISRNSFTIASLPIVKSSVAGFRFRYAPQREYAVPNRGPGIDLSPLAYASDGVTPTQFALTTAEGQTLKLGTDYTCDGGHIGFLSPIVGRRVYATMTNPALPAFTGLDVYRTSTLVAAEFPTNCIAEFTTTAEQTASLSLAAWDKEGTALYIDWNGNGIDLQQYILKDTYTRFSATTTPGAKVKVYTYSPEERIKVFSMTGVSMSQLDCSKMTDLLALTIDGAGIDENTARLPITDTLRELNLGSNKFTTFPTEQYPALTSLHLGANKLTSFDTSAMPNLQWLSLSANMIDHVVLKGDHLIQIDLSDNLLEEVDLSGVPELPQLALSGNKLSHLDISMLPRLIMLMIDRNRFTFQTLPPVRDSFRVYVYGNQAMLQAKCDDGIVDLSSQAVADGAATAYTWWVDAPELDENGMLVGEQLIEGEEYTCAEGVTTFMIDLDHVMCVMTNEKFPSLYLLTNFMDIQRHEAGISDVIADDCEGEAEYFDLNGRKVSNPSAGIYIRRIGAKVEKVIVR